VDAREEYILSLEKENDYLREELKTCKFNNEKVDYSKFVTGLTRRREGTNIREKSNPASTRITELARPMPVLERKASIPAA
jgi:hypothetical protein